MILGRSTACGSGNLLPNVCSAEGESEREEGGEGGGRNCLGEHLVVVDRGGEGEAIVVQEMCQGQIDLILWAQESVDCDEGGASSLPFLGVGERTHQFVSGGYIFWRRISQPPSLTTIT